MMRDNSRLTCLRALGGTTLSALVAITPVATAVAAPSTDGDKPSKACESETSLESAMLITGRNLYARGNERFEAKDYLGAVEAWEQVRLLMPEKEGELRVQLAHAHRRAYPVDNDADHLYAAQGLFAAQLDSLDADDPARGDIEVELEDIAAVLDLLAQAQAQAQAQRDEAIRQEQIRLNQEALAQAEAERQRKLQKVLFGLGGSLTGLGAGSLAAMAAFLVLGDQQNREGWKTTTATGTPEEIYQQQLDNGMALNRAAVVTGVVGGGLMAVGVSMLVTAGVRQQRLGHHDKLAVAPTLGGVQLRF